MVMGGLATAGDLGAAAGPLAAYALLGTVGLHTAYALCAELVGSALLALAAAGHAIPGGAVPALGVGSPR